MKTLKELKNYAKKHTGHYYISNSRCALTESVSLACDENPLMIDYVFDALRQIREEDSEYYHSTLGVVFIPRIPYANYPSPYGKAGDEGGLLVCRGYNSVDKEWIDVVSFVFEA